MSRRTNEHDQPIGDPLDGWVPPPRPERTVLRGRYCTLEPLDGEAHAAALFEADSVDEDGRSWTYMPHGPYAGLDDFRAWVESASRSDDPLFFTIVEAEGGVASGVASYLRIQPEAGSIEVGWIHYAPRLQRTRAATEAMFLLMEHAFALGYRRYEWKCDALNDASRRAALRLGFTFEGVFRKATVYKGRNRDTAWYSIVDDEWPALRRGFERWLDPENFDGAGRQRARLEECLGG